jgi:hypothetical protein
MASDLNHVTDHGIKLREVSYFYKADRDYGTQLAQATHLDVNELLPSPPRNVALKQQGPATPVGPSVNRCRGKAAAAIVKESKMPRVPTAFLITVLWLVPAGLAGPALAFVQLVATLDDAAAASAQHDAASPSQDHIKEIFFDAARQGRDDLLDS